LPSLGVMRYRKKLTIWTTNLNLLLRWARLFLSQGDRLVGRAAPRSSSEEWTDITGIMYVFLLLIFLSAYALFYYAIGASKFAHYSLLAFEALLIIVVPLLIAAGARWVRFGIACLLTAGSIMLAVIAAHTGGINSSTASWLLSIAPGIAASIYRKKWPTIGVAALGFVLYTVVFVVELRGYNVHQLGLAYGSGFERLYTYIHFILFSVFNTMIIAVFAISHARIYFDLEQSKIHLEFAHESQRTILMSLEEAVFLIGNGLSIISEKSPRFLSVLGSDINTAQDLLNQLDLSDDQRHQSINVLRSIIGSMAIGFDLNAHLLPTQAVLKKSFSSRQLTLKWVPVVSEGITESMLVQVQDITDWLKEKEFAKEAGQRTDILYRIAHIEQRQRQNVVLDISQTANRVSTLIENEPLSWTALRTTLHTLKGTARAYGLQRLADLCHAAEDQASRSDLETLSTELRAGIGQIRTYTNLVQETYLDAFDQSKDWRNKVEVDADALDQAIAQVSSVDDSLADSLRVFLPTSLASVVTFLQEEANALAIDLKIPPPHIETATPSVVLPKYFFPSLAEAFGHILRNAMDHAFAGDDEMRSSESNSITLEASSGNGMTEITIEDSGRGLDLDGIKEIASRKKLSFASDEEAADFIFQDTFTTRAHVSLVSGRGIGMVAARSAIEGLGGQLKIEFRGHRFAGRQPFRLIVSLPRIGQTDAEISKVG